MKILQLTFTASVLLLCATSCKKTDFQDELPQEAQITSAALADSTSSSSASIDISKETGWYSATTWEVEKQEDFSIFYINVPDAAITSEVVDNGLVLLFKNDRSSLSSLPVEENSKSESRYWYHQVTEGNIMISVDSYGAALSPDASSNFKYFILTPEKLQELEAQGQTVESLMNLSYQEASALLK
jgi:hypothetical protein